MNNQKVILLSLLFFCFSLTPAFAEWEPEQVISPNMYSGLDATTSHNGAWCVAAYGDVVHAVWTQKVPGPPPDYNPYPLVFYNRSIDGGVNWGEGYCIDTMEIGSWGHSSRNPAIAIQKAKVYVVYSRHDPPPPSGGEIWYVHSPDAGNNWNLPAQVTFDGDTYLNENPSVAVCDISNSHEVHSVPGVHIVYNIGITMRGSYQSVNYTRLGAFDVILAELFVSPASIAVSNNVVHVVWEKSHEIYYTFSTNRGVTWKTPVSITTGFNPSIAASGNRVHVVWHDNRDPEGGPEIYYKCGKLIYLSPNETFEQISVVNTIWKQDIRITDANSSEYPSIAASGSNIHIAWQDWRDGNTEIYYKHLISGPEWGTHGEPILGPDIRLTTNIYASESPSIAVSGSTLHVIWYDNRDDGWHYRIYYKRNPTGNPLNPGSASANETQDTGLGSVTEQLHIVPNPFISYARVPGCENDDFLLYDITGRHLGIYRGNRIGADLSPGVYFMKGLSSSSKPVCIVKAQ